MNVIERIDSRVVNPAVIFGRRLRLQYAICTIKEHAAKLQELFSEINPGFLNAINGLIAQNNNLLAFATIEKNEKTVNQLSLLAMPSGVAALSASQLSDLQSIADQCPLVGGEAVLRARALLTEVAETPLFWLDNSLCGGANRPVKGRSTVADESAPLLRCLPNPTTDELNIEYANLGSNDRNLVLYNVYGQEVLSVDLREGATRGRTKAVVSSLPEGLYFYFLIGIGSRVQGGQIIIQR